MYRSIKNDLCHTLKMPSNDVDHLLSASGILTLDSN